MKAICKLFLITLQCIWLGALCYGQSSQSVSQSTISDGANKIEQQIDTYLADHSVQPIADDKRLLLDQYQFHFLFLFDTSQSSPSPSYREFYAGVAQEFLQRRRAAQDEYQNEAHFSMLAYQLDLYEDTSTPGTEFAAPTIDKTLSQYDKTIHVPIDQIKVRTGGAPYEGGKNHQDSRLKAIQEIASKVSEPVITIQFSSSVGSEPGKNGADVPKGEGSEGGLPDGYSEIGKGFIQTLEGAVKAYVWLYSPSTLSNLKQVTKPQTPAPDAGSQPSSPSSPPSSPDIQPSGQTTAPSNDNGSNGVIVILVVAGVVIAVGVLTWWYLTKKITLSINDLPVGHVFAGRPAKLYTATGNIEDDANRLSLSKKASRDLPEGSVIANLSFDPFSGTLKIACTGGFTASTESSSPSEAAIFLKCNDTLEVTFHQKTYEFESEMVKLGVSV